MYELKEGIFGKEQRNVNMERMNVEILRKEFLFRSLSAVIFRNDTICFYKI